MARFIHSIVFRVSAIVFFVYLILFTVSLLFIDRLVGEGFEKVEISVADDDRSRIGLLLGNDAERLSELCREYSVWDETYAFIGNLNRRYLERNMNADWRRSVSLRSIAFLDPAGNLLIGFRADADSIVFQEESVPEFRGLVSAAKRIVREPGVKTGIADVSGMALLYAAEPVVLSDGTGEPGGFLVFSKILDQDYFKRLSSIAGGAVSPAAPSARDGVSFEPSRFVSTFTVGIGNKDALRLTVLRDRRLWQIGRSLLWALAILFNGANFAACAVLLASLRIGFIKPLALISAQVGRVARLGDFSARLAISGGDELAVLSSDINGLISRIEEREAELQRLNAELDRIANTDRLTGLANRRRFDSHLEGELRRMRRASRGVAERGKIAFLLCDVDFFKSFNDTYGHLSGDSCLSAIGAALSSAIRRPGDLACRFGGEEFLVVLPDCGADGAATVAENLLEAVRSLAVPHSGSSVADVVTVSVGIAVGSVLEEAGAPFSPERLLEEADAALYRAKKEGRNRFCG